MKDKIKHFKPGIPTDLATTMGAIISKTQYERILGFIELAKQEGGRLLHGGGRPSDPALAKGLFIEPTVSRREADDADRTRRDLARYSPSSNGATRPPCSRR